jgi:hypothetical protein
MLALIKRRTGVEDAATQITSSCGEGDENLSHSIGV